MSHGLNWWIISAALVSSDALACGGFFCQTVPVEQAAERIVFAIDEEASKVEVHVQISYEGAAEEFAWIVPVAANPELFPSVDDLFTRLSPLTRPQWNLTFETDGECKSSNRNFDSAVAESDDASAPNDGGGGVTVAQETAVGPYDVVVLQATDSAELITWLQDNDYALPDELEPKLAPYVASESYFVALRLQKGNDAGDLVPLGMRYTGVDGSIPLQLTAVAATPDMRLQPYVFAKHRAIPLNYLHVEVNELAVDWMSGGANYEDVVAEAANEAGGLAFATDFSGSTAAMGGTMWAPGMYDVAPIRGQTTLSAVINALQGQAGIPVSQGTVPILARFLEVPANLLAQDVTPLQFFACPDCYLDGSTLPMDGDGVADALAAEWIPAMESAEHLFADYPTLTRLTSSISAEEMEIDPIFSVNAEMPAVSNVHNARMITMCEKRFFSGDAPRRLVLEDGRELYFPASYATGGGDFNFDSWLGEVGEHKAQRIEQLGRSGSPLLMNDFSEEIALAAEAHNTAFVASIGCGCQQGRGAGGIMWMVAMLGAVLRRRTGRSVAS
jgi:hypothetical protein